MFRGGRVPTFVMRSVALAGLSIFAVAYVGVSPAHADCEDRQDRLAASQSDPRYPALQQAVDSYLAERQTAEGFSGVSGCPSIRRGRPSPSSNC